MNQLQQFFLSVRKSMARSNLLARTAARLERQLRGVVYLHLGHEHHLRESGEEWLAKKLAPTCHTFMDVGANVGDWTAMFCKYAPNNARGILYEPSELALQAITPRFDRWSQHLEVVRAGVADTIGEACFHQEPDAGKTSSLVSGFSDPQAQEVVIPTLTLDSEAEKRGIQQIDFLKIDTEGYDLHVLRGASQLLEAQRIRFLQFEYNEPWRQAGSTLSEAFRLLKQAGYKVFLLKGDGLYRFPYHIYREFYHYANFVAFPAARSANLRYMVRGTI